MMCYNILDKRAKVNMFNDISKRARDCFIRFDVLIGNSYRDFHCVIWFQDA